MALATITYYGLDILFGVGCWVTVKTASGVYYGVKWLSSTNNQTYDNENRLDYEICHSSCNIGSDYQLIRTINDNKNDDIIYKLLDIVKKQNIELKNIKLLLDNK